MGQGVEPLYPSISQSLDIRFLLKKRGLGLALCNQVQLLGAGGRKREFGCEPSALTLSVAGTVCISVMGIGRYTAVFTTITLLFCITKFSDFGVDPFPTIGTPWTCQPPELQSLTLFKCCFSTLSTNTYRLCALFTFRSCSCVFHHKSFIP